MTSDDRSQKLRHIISALMDVPTDEITEDSSPDTLASWSSVAHLNLVVALEEAFNISFSPEETMELSTVRLIEMMLDEKIVAA